MAEPSKLTFPGKLVVFLFIAGCLYGAWHLWSRRGGGAAEPSDEAAAEPGERRRTGFFERSGPSVEIGIAYGTEKKRWLEWAVARFAEAEEGEGITVKLLPMGSLEGAQAIQRGDERIHVWSPASALYEDAFVQEWGVQHGGADPIAREETLALSPMVFVLWNERHAAFTAKYGDVSFETIGQALAEPAGWQGIAAKPEWGLFKFGHTHPNESNSGLMTLVLMAYDFHGKTRGLELADILDPRFQEWSQGIERAVTGLSNSTGNMMREMVLKGPSAFDAVFVYENVAIDYLKNAEGRWGELRLSYPERNMWNDNPYYVLDVPWSSEEQRQAAGRFLEFLLSEPIQRQSLVHGFRPGNPAVPVKAPDSPFTTYSRFGLEVDLGSVCDPPRAEVLNNLLASWQRSVGAR